MKAGRAFVGAGLLVLPFILSLEGEQMRAPKGRFLVLLGALYLAQLLWRKIHPSLGCAVAVFSLSALFRAISLPWEELAVFLAAMTSCLWVRGASKDELERGFKLLELAGLVCAFYGAVLQHQGADPFLRALPGRTLTHPPVFFGQHTLYGPFAVACFASALFHGRHFLAVLLALPIFLVSSSFTFLSFGVVLFLYALRRFGKYAFLGAMACALGLFAYSKIRPGAEEFNDSGRFRVWRLVADIANERAILGHGAGSFRVIFPILQAPQLRKLNGIDDQKQGPKAKAWFEEANQVHYYWGVFQHPHNELLSVYFELGLIGVLIALWWAIAGVWECFRPWLDLLPGQDPGSAHWALAAIFLSALANSIGNFNFHLVPQALLPLWAFVAMTTRQETLMLEEYAAHDFRG